MWWIIKERVINNQTDGYAHGHKVTLNISVFNNKIVVINTYSITQPILEFIILISS